MQVLLSCWSPIDNTFMPYQKYMRVDRLLSFVYVYEMKNTKYFVDRKVEKKQ